MLVPERKTAIPPKSFTIGKLSTRGLVSVEKVKGHLKLLHAFYELRVAVEENTETTARLPAWAREMEPDRRWAWFIALAVERFQIWCKKVVNAAADSHPPPPLDVIMVWHSYLLNPFLYAEDSVYVPLVADGLAKFQNFWVRRLPYMAEFISTQHMGSQVRDWEKKTSIPFDPFESSAALTHRNIECPACGQMSPTPFYLPTGLGYAQLNFQHTCQCGFIITKDNLGLLRFARMIALDKNTLPAGTICSPSSSTNTTFARHLKSLVTDYIFKNRTRQPVGSFDYKPNEQIHYEGQKKPKKVKGPRRTLEGDEWVHKICKGCEYSTSQARTIFKQYKYLNDRILNCYSDDRPFSLDLAGAVLRQSSFVKKMFDLSWTKPGLFDNREDEMALHHAIARYHAFLDLISSSDNNFLVPTLDIDLVWHTHQLMGRRYESDCRRYIGRAVDHDDKIEENKLSTGFDDTCRAWQLRFHVPYMYCGCPLPGVTIGQKLRRLTAHYNASAHSYLKAPAATTDASAHPSDHNATFVSNSRYPRLGNKGRDRCKKQLAVRQKKDVQVEVTHEPAFLIPVPLVYQDGETSGCTAASGNVLFGSNCAAGAGGCSAGREPGSRYAGAGGDGPAVRNGGSVRGGGGGGCGGGCGGS